MFSGTLGEDHAVEAMKAGLDDYVVKDPRRLPRLQIAIRAALERWRDRQARRVAEERYEALFRDVKVGLYVSDAAGRFVDANATLLRMLAVNSLNDLRGIALPALFKDESTRGEWAGLAEAGTEEREIELLLPDGRTCFVLLTAHRRGPDRVEGSLTDISALKRVLEEKSVLLREVFHRVYNNLQLVLAMLGMQAERAEDAAVRREFRDLSMRIRSLALIQQQLYRGDNVSRIDLGPYLRDLAEAMRAVVGRPEIVLKLSLASVIVNIEKAIPLGLVANELLSNAYMHAYPPGQSGEIGVELRGLADGRAAMTIADGGNPVMPGPRKAGTGMALIQGLVEQLNAEADYDRSRGTAATITFAP
jgi:two-component sensor histidine kinase